MGHLAKERGSQSFLIVLQSTPSVQVMYRDGTFDLPGDAEGSGWSKVRLIYSRYIFEQGEDNIYIQDIFWSKVRMIYIFKIYLGAR